MGISTKNKRKLVFQDQQFYWWIKDEFDGHGGMLSINIASEDKVFLVKYYSIQNQLPNRYLTIIGNFFPGLERKSGNWQRFVCPDFVPEIEKNGIQPKNIESMIDWCFDENKTLMPVNAKGEMLNK